MQLLLLNVAQAAALQIAAASFLIASLSGIQWILHRMDKKKMLKGCNKAHPQSMLTINSLPLILCRSQYPTLWQIMLCGAHVYSHTPSDSNSHIYVSSWAP